jgi:hypothetical protein
MFLYMSELFLDRVHFVTPLLQKTYLAAFGHKNRDFVRIKSRGLELLRPIRFCICAMGDVLNVA